MTNHLELLNELQQLDKAPSLERLRAAQKRRTQQLKRWAIYEKEMQNRKRKTDRRRGNGNHGNAAEIRKRVSFAANVALLEASARNDLQEVQTVPKGKKHRKNKSKGQPDSAPGLEISAQPVPVPVSGVKDAAQSVPVPGVKYATQPIPVSSVVDTALSVPVSGIVDATLQVPISSIVDTALIHTPHTRPVPVPCARPVPETTAGGSPVPQKATSRGSPVTPRTREAASRTPPLTPEASLLSSQTPVTPPSVAAMSAPVPIPIFLPSPVADGMLMAVVIHVSVPVVMHVHSIISLCFVATAWMGTVLALFLFNIYTSDFRYNSGTCHLQKFSDDMAIVRCMRNGQVAEYWKLVSDWCELNQLQLNIRKPKEMVVDFRKLRPPLSPVTIDGVDVEVVSTLKYLGMHLDIKLDWSSNTCAVFKKGQNRLYFLRRQSSFGVRSRLLWTFYQSVVFSAMFYAIVC
ncbi:hypothetical protein P4O66_001145 [Electrophorus voltai]|uniref:Alkylated DNA repair protein AlkB homologue 8 N-terminal domain-containing protein n=1 Tax=Electrophorus voltai TaxID=2609070 RepID=A0AAD8ZDB0_9TELE|nr:hypothetical protein P4O66_001145 [Electrophorus voltai]